MDRLSTVSALKASHPVEVLRTSLIAYVAFGISTSGVEQKFSLSALKFNARQMRALEAKEDMFLKVCLDYPERDPDKTAKKAQEIWDQCFGRPRLERKFSSRIDKGVKRDAHKLSIGSEVDFIRQRRKAAKLAASATSAADSAGQDIRPGSNWGESHAKELAFLNKKEESKRFLALRENALLPQEVTHAVREGTAAKFKKQLADQLARTRKVGRVRAAMQGMTASAFLDCIKGKNVFVDQPCRSPEVARALPIYRLKPVRMHAAEVFVVESPARAGLFISAASAIKGGYMLTPRLLNSGRVGVGIRVMPTFHLKKTMFLSADFRGAQGQFCTFLQNVISSTPNCKWKLGGFNWPALKKANAPAALFALVMPPEVAMPTFKNHRNTFTIDSFVARISKVDMSKSVAGLR